jgi:hypothetical protein
LHENDPTEKENDPKEKITEGRKTDRRSDSFSKRKLTPAYAKARSGCLLNPAA